MNTDKKLVLTQKKLARIAGAGLLRIAATSQTVSADAVAKAGGKLVSVPKTTGKLKLTLV